MLSKKQLKKFMGRKPIPATDEEIQKLEETLSVKFPPEYIELVKLHDEGHLGPFSTNIDDENHFDMHAIDITLYPSVGCGVLDAWGFMERPRDIIPIGGVGNGDEILLNFRDNRENPTVWLWSHDDEEQYEGGYLSMEHLADDFRGLLKMMGKKGSPQNRVEKLPVLSVEWEEEPEEEIDERIKDINPYAPASKILPQVMDIYPHPPRPACVERWIKQLEKRIRLGVG